MGPIGMPEMIMIFLILAILAGGALLIAGFVYFLVKKQTSPLSRRRFHQSIEG